MLNYHQENLKIPPPSPHSLTLCPSYSLLIFFFDRAPLDQMVQQDHKASQ